MTCDDPYVPRRADRRTHIHCEGGHNGGVGLACCRAISYPTTFVFFVALRLGPVLAVAPGTLCVSALCGALFRCRCCLLLLFVWGGGGGGGGGGGVDVLNYSHNHHTTT